LWEAARRLAQNVLASQYRDPSFPGATEFILGVVAARGAETDPDRISRLTAAAKYLRAAERQGIDERRRPEWAFALGLSLYELNRMAEARPILEESWLTYPPGKTATGLALAELELVDPSPHAPGRLDHLLDELDARSDITRAQQRQLLSLRARSALQDGRLDDTEQVLARVNKDHHEAALLWAELWLARDRPEDARRWLLPLAFPTSVDDDPKITAAAAYLLGRCDEKRGDAAAAARAYERAATVAPNTSEGTASALAAAQLLQLAGRDEEALALYRQAIESQSSNTPPPLSPDTFRVELRAGWDRWVERDAFDSAISLATDA